MLDLSFEFSKPCFYPGELLVGTCKVCNAGAVDGPKATITSLGITFSGLEKIDPSWISVYYLPHTPAIGKENRRIVRTIFQSEVAPLSPDLTLPAGASQEFGIRFKLPNRIPPSFRGSALHFQYQVTARILFRCAGEDVPRGVEARAPLSVWPSAERSLERRSSLAQVASGGVPSGSAPPSPASPHAPHHPPEDLETDMIDYALQGAKDSVQAKIYQLSERFMERMSPKKRNSAKDGFPTTTSHKEEVSSSCPHPDRPENGFQSTSSMPLEKRGSGLRANSVQRISSVPRTYNLTAGVYNFMKITFHPPLDILLQPGGTFGCVLDFRTQEDPSSRPEHVPRCLQVVALLETEEMVYSPYKHPSASGTIRKLYAEHQELTPDVDLTHFLFSIPPSAAPSFRTPMVGLRWVVRFELSISHPKSKHSDGNWMPVEQVVWCMPLVVFPPSQAYLREM